MTKPIENAKINGEGVDEASFPDRDETLGSQQDGGVAAGGHETQLVEDMKINGEGLYAANSSTFPLQPSNLAEVLTSQQLGGARAVKIAFCTGGDADCAVHVLRGNCVLEEICPKWRHISLSIFEQVHDFGPGGRVWDAALVLASHLTRTIGQRDGSLTGKSAIEIGAGFCRAFHISISEFSPPAPPCQN